jgi:hypothetical protein
VVAGLLARPPQATRLSIPGGERKGRILGRFGKTPGAILTGKIMTGISLTTIDKLVFLLSGLLMAWGILIFKDWKKNK